MNNFTGFFEPEENWSKLPHQFIESMNAIDSLAEMKVVLYVLRHTWGFQDREKRITLDEFCDGRKRKDGSRLDAGTGMSANAIRDGIQRAIDDGFIVITHEDTSDKARIKRWYAMRMFGTEPSKVDPGLSEVDANLDSQRSTSDVNTSTAEPRSEKETPERNLFLKNPKTEIGRAHV